ncbi:MAG: histidinol phosphatase [Ilumatobacteraceae bacterium]|nr:histidinol phosphatase [Ilumatobacteraceae bacterium]
MSNDLPSELIFALELADIADAITLPHFANRTFSVDLKENLTEVTKVDRNTETALVNAIKHSRPQHAWYGEEHGTGGDSEWTWVIDPIDGTSNFVRGVPIFATLLALVHVDLGPVVGVVSAPALHTRWWGGINLGAYRNNRPIRVSTTDNLLDAHGSLTPNAAWNTAGKSQNIHRLQQQLKRERGFGDFWQHMLVADGSIDLAVDAIGLEPYDIAALVPIVYAAGGTLTDRTGVNNWRANSAVSSNSTLHSAVISILNA